MWYLALVNKQVDKVAECSGSPYTFPQVQLLCFVVRAYLLCLLWATSPVLCCKHTHSTELLCLPCATCLAQNRLPGRSAGLSNSILARLTPISSSAVNTDIRVFSVFGLCGMSILQKLAALTLWTTLQLTTSKQPAWLSISLNICTAIARSDSAAQGDHSACVAQHCLLGGRHS